VTRRTHLVTALAFVFVVPMRAQTPTPAPADFANADVSVYFPGAAQIMIVPSTALVPEDTTTHVSVQHTPERFEFREVRIHRTFGTSSRSRAA
jgi:hypothetical protein